jgi:hypothetical protein
MLSTMQRRWTNVPALHSYISYTWSRAPSKRANHVLDASQQEWFGSSKFPWLAALKNIRPSESRGRITHSVGYSST